MVEHALSFSDSEVKPIPYYCMEGICYLNNAAAAPLSPSVISAGWKAMQQPPWAMESDDDQEAVRRLFSQLIAADEDCVATMPSTAFAITLAAENIKRTAIRPRKILVLQDQMCSAVYGFQNICDTTEGFTLEIVPYPSSDGGWTQSVLENLSDDIVVACVPPLHWSDGAIIDLDAVGVSCRHKGIVLIVDATQAVGIMPINVGTIKPALLACSIHKWLRGPVGMCLVYVEKDLHQKWLPLDQHGRSRDHHGSGSAWDASKDEMGPGGYSADYLQGARKFDSGGKPNPLLLPMLRASLTSVINIDVAQVQIDLQHLMQPLLDWAEGKGWLLTPGQHVSHLIGLRPKNMATKQMVDICVGLQDDGVYIAVRCGAFRISPYVDTTTADIERLIAGFECHMKNEGIPDR
jgi:selenocysteine lyase/cysteine desulfurase